MHSRVTQPEKRKRSRLTRAAEIAGIVAAAAAVVTLLLDLGPGGGGDRGTAITSPTQPSTQPPAPPPSGNGGTPAPNAVTRYLTDLPPDSGGANVQRVGPHSLRMVCGSGNNTDANRTVTYLLPPATAYRSFTTVLSVAGRRDTRIQAILSIDDRVAAEPVVAAGSTAPLAWHGDPAGKLTLQIRCDPYATAATFSDPGLSG